MKKLLFIFLLTLVLNGSASAEKLYFDCTQVRNNLSHEFIRYIVDPQSDYLTVHYKWQDDYYNKYIGKRIKAGTPLESELQRKIISNNGTSMEVQMEHNIIRFNYGGDGKAYFKNMHFLDCNKTNKFLDKDEIKKQEMMFTINDKREQCEAIGFKPETEKFADCVLRLVELDIKKQQQTQVTVAQNNGNDALVKQLKRQNDIQSSQALINLGQQLLQPKKFNSNIYMPQTQRCTVQGFGSFSSVTCR